MPLKIEAKAQSADIWIYGEIGESGFSSDAVSAESFSKEIKALKGIETITLHINSPGGSVFDGVAIYNLLVNHPAKIVSEIEGAALSIASVIALSGNTVRMAGNAFFMIHNPWSYAMGDASEMRAMAERLDLIRATLIGTYAKRTGDLANQEQISEWMNAETWFSADKALEAGFIDEVTNPIDMAGSFDLSRYHFKNMPKASVVKKVVSRDEALRARMARMNMLVTKHCLLARKAG